VTAITFSRAQTVRAMDALSATMMVDPPDGSEQRRGKIVPAARWVTIDYRSIVANAVAALADNTPDARRDVYAEARGVVHRHLQLMRLPEPIVELEKLALDLTIRKIERQNRAVRAADEEATSEQEVEAKPTARDAAHALGAALREAGQSFASLMIMLGLRPVFYALWIVASPLRLVARAIFSPVGLAAGVPITALLVTTFYLLDTNTGFQTAVTVRTAQFLEQVDAWLNAAAPSGAGKDEERVAGLIEPPPSVGSAPARAVPARARVTPSSRHRDGANAPPAEPNVVGALARPRAPSGAPSPDAAASNPAASNPNVIPKWFSGYATVVNAAPMASAALPVAAAARPGEPKAAGTKSSSRPDSRSVPDGSEPGATDSAADGVPDDPPAEPRRAPYTLATANSLAAIPDGAPPLPVTLPPLRVPAPKVAALIETGRKAAAADDLEKAVRDFTEAVRLDPIYPGGYTERGQALFKLGETDRAIADFSNAIKRDPNYGPALRGRAMANLYQGATELALTDLTKAIRVAEIDPNRLSPLELFYARRSRANIYGTKMQYDGEIADCSAILDAYKRDKVLGTALLGAYQAEGAANLIATIYRQRANAYIRQSNPEQARADLTAAVPLSADRGFSALVDRARLNEAIGQRDQAIADLQAALNIRPGSEEARIALRRISSGPPPAPARPSGRT
jgi:tetratricopeptide (TPR) repeat protein